MGLYVLPSDEKKAEIDHLCLATTRWSLIHRAYRYTGLGHDIHHDDTLVAAIMTASLVEKITRVSFAGQRT